MQHCWQHCPSARLAAWQAAQGLLLASTAGGWIAYPGEVGAACKERLKPESSAAGQQDGTGLAAVVLPTRMNREATYRSAIGPTACAQ